MTKTRDLIISMINHGYRDADIVRHTDKSRGYVSKIRFNLSTDPHYYETQKTINRINNYKPKKEKKDYSGVILCNRCDEQFKSWDRRHNRTCEKCTASQVADVYMINESGWGGGRWIASHAE